ncbi:MAG: cob(I)yrinic acid a,c-diamide adenosyltransferase [Corynebacterium sp.]|nr:cob(I)yrinic acid a,c-diamide adenosyltransferase [Corynebacterium sp.]
MAQGKVTVPDDGLSTRQRRLLPITAVHTGDGKGKSTAAFGMGLRAHHAGMNVAVFQFVKSPKWKVGEEAVYKELGMEWHKMGTGWSWIRHKEGVDPEQAAKDGWAEVARRLEKEENDFYILDEFTYPVTWGWLDVEEVVDTLKNRPGTQHVVMTGRNAHSRLIEIADLVTEMRKIKHPMDQGRKGQKGIEW